MTAGLRPRLSLQMFLQFAIWGSWAPVLGKHLANVGLSPGQIGAIYGTGALATMLSPLVAGQIADRWFATERFMSVSFFASAGAFWCAAHTTDYHSLWWLSLVAMLFFAPTLALGNSISFHHLDDPRKQFAAIRVWGTIGWIASGWALNRWMDATGRPIGDCLILAAAYSVANGIYCLTLPHTPPQRGTRERFALGKALAMFGDPSFALFTVLAFLLLVFASFYYFLSAIFFPTLGVADKDLSLVSSIGQIAEIAGMFVLPLALVRLGSKTTISIGLFAWAARFAMYAIGKPFGLVLAAQAIHGVCFAFTIAAAMIYVERICASDVRASAQSLLTFVTYGLGMFAGAWLAGQVSEHYTVDRVADWRAIWTVPAVGSLVVALAFVAGFRARDAEKTPAAPARESEAAAV
jgi:nucleoside transporter